MATIHTGALAQRHTMVRSCYCVATTCCKYSIYSTSPIDTSCLCEAAPYLHHLTMQQHHAGHTHTHRDTKPSTQPAPTHNCAYVSQPAAPAMAHKASRSSFLPLALYARVIASIRVLRAPQYEASAGRAQQPPPHTSTNQQAPLTGLTHDPNTTSHHLSWAHVRS
jgi:hypothetical protein